MGFLLKTLFMSTLKEQYQAIKAKYIDAILLFRVGEYYEAFGEDAKVVSQHLGVTLTESKDPDLKFHAGFPHYSLDAYLRKLVKAGNRVAICEQLEDPKKAKGIVKRGVTDLMK